MDPWVIPPMDHARHVEQFKTLNPMNGFITGDQAKGLFLQSGLPPVVLGQIWGLADADCDGKMNINEFIVACKLITMKLKGFEVPAALPPPLRAIISGTNTSTPVSPTGSLQSPQMAPISATGIVSPPLIPGVMSPTRSQVPTAVPGVMQGVGMPLSSPPQTLPLGDAMIQGQAAVRPPYAAPEMQKTIFSRSASVASQDSITSPLMEWSVPNASRLKYTQLFNQHDRGKTGFIAGVQARSILLETGLPQQILAQIWGLSDMDSDGRLSCEEFILSLHLCDCYKQMEKLPSKLPPDLIPPSFRSSSRKHSVRPGSGTQSGVNTGSNTPTFEGEKLTMSTSNSFEDKRKENYDKGQAELDRRRKLIQDMENREKEERKRKEREEFERKEKARLEQERREQEERERRLAMEREMEERRQEELRRAQENKEAARRELERQRMNEIEEAKRQELLNRRQKLQEEVLRLKGVNNGLGLENSHLIDKVKELSSNITETRMGVSSVKSEIDGMRTKRDTLMSEMTSFKNQLKDQNNRMLMAAQEKVRVEKLAAESETKQLNLNQQREKLQNLKDQLDKNETDSKSANEQLDELKATLSTLIESCKSLHDNYKEKREEVILMKRKHHEEFDPNAAWGTEPVPAATDTQISSAVDGSFESDVTYYRALFDFEARSTDEISFAVGAIIKKDDSVPTHPGWLYGTINGSSGLFPEDFVEIVPSSEVFNAEFEVESARRMSVEGAPPEGGEYYIAMFPYESAEAGDLAFDAGEVIVVSHKDGEWWTGQIGERVGIFPANYVAKHDQVIAHSNDTTAAAEEGTISATAGSTTMASVEEPVINSGFGDGDTMNKIVLEPSDEADIKREICEITKAPPQKSPKTKRKYEVATVLANYQATTEGQLHLVRGQLITVRKKSASGWWEGELQAKGKRKEIGWFPGSYVKVLGPAGGSRAGSSRTTPIHFEEIEMPTTDAPVFSDVKEQVVALYPYTAQNSDELTFQKDDVITILSKDEPEWWRGQLNNAIGLFPCNYVQFLSQSGINQLSEQSLEVEQNGGKQVEDFSSFDQQSMDYREKRTDSIFSIQSDFSSMNDAKCINPKYLSEWNLREFQDQEYDSEWSNSSLNLNRRMSSRYSVSSVCSAGSEYMVDADETKRQGAIKELLDSEESYLNDMKIVKECFKVPLAQSGLLTEDELQSIFVNWEDLIDCSSKLVKAFHIRRQCSQGGMILIIGDILCQHVPVMRCYIRFCSAQLNSAAIMQRKSEKSQKFRDFCKSCERNSKTKSLPLSSFLIKPMQRVTKYPLLIKKMLEYTSKNHPDLHNLEEALSKAEELCAQVNEGVREKETSDRLEWLQNHINCEGLEERLIFNSSTNALGPRKYLHHGFLRKTKSGKELVGFLFNDFLLLALPNKSLQGTAFSFEKNKNMQFKIYRKPLFLNEIKILSEEGLAENEFVLWTKSNSCKMYVGALTASEKKLWVKTIEEAISRYQQVEQQYIKRQKSKKQNVVGRLLVVVMEGLNLSDRVQHVRGRRPKGWLRILVIGGKSLKKPTGRGKCNPYCEVSLGSEVKRTPVAKGTLSPKWSESMQFSVKDIRQDILSVTVFDKDYFSPDRFLGRTEISILKIYEDSKNYKGAYTKKLKLLEIENGEIMVKFHLQIFGK